MRRKKKIVKGVIISVVVVVVLFLVGCETGVINLYEKSNNQMPPVIPVDELTSLMDIQQHRNYEHNDRIADAFFNDLEVTGYEICGSTEYDFEIAEAEADSFAVFYVLFDGKPETLYLVPMKDGKELPYVYECNADATLTLVWSGKQ